MNKSVFYSIFTAVLVSTLLSGCRFGNHADEPQPLPNSGKYKTLEFFFTDPVQLETRVYLNSISGPDAVVHENLNSAFSAIPENISKVFSSIVYFAIPNDPEVNPSIIDSSGTNEFFTKIDENGNPSYSSPLPRPEYVLWNNPNCGISDHVIHDGSFDRTEAQTIQIGGKNVNIAGGLKFQYGYSIRIQSYNGTDNCDADLTYLANCYTTPGCSAETVKYAKDIFDVVVRAGVLNIADAAKLKVLEYIVHYE